MCRVLGSSWEAQFLAPGHQSMDVWHLLFCHWNGAMKRTCIIHPLHLVRGWWCRIELVSSGVGIEQGWELGQPISQSYKRRLGGTYHGCGPGCPSMPAHLKKTPMCSCYGSSRELPVSLLEVPLHSCGKDTWASELSEMCCLEAGTGQTEQLSGLFGIWSPVLSPAFPLAIFHCQLWVLRAGFIGSDSQCSEGWCMSIMSLRLAKAT